MDVATGAAVADDNADSTVVPPSLVKDEGAYVGVLVAFEGVCVGGHRCLLIVACPRRSQRCIRIRHLQVTTAADCRPRLRERRTVAVDAMVRSV